MKSSRPNIIVILCLLTLSLIVTFFEGIYKGLYGLVTGKVQPMRNTRLLQIWHWMILDGPKRFWKDPTWYHATRSLATLLEVIVYPQKK